MLESPLSNAAPRSSAVPTSAAYFRFIAERCEPVKRLAINDEPDSATLVNLRRKCLGVVRQGRLDGLEGADRWRSDHGRNVDGQGSAARALPDHALGRRTPCDRVDCLSNL